MEANTSTGTLFYGDIKMKNASSKVPSVGSKIKTGKDTTMEVTNVVSGKLTRYDVRNTLFRMRDDRLEERHKVLAEMIWPIIQQQLKPNEGLRTFTFDWDVNPGSPLMVIRRDEWDEIKKERYPEEYKKQEKVEEEITMFTAQK